MTDSSRTPETGGASLFRALRHRNYRIYIVGQLISLVGTWMQIIAQSWLVYRLSHSAFTLGLIGFIGQIPIFILGPVAGVVADRVNRRRLLVVMQVLCLVQAALLAALTLAGAVTIPIVVGLALLLGIFSAFDFPARQAFIFELVEREDLLNAIALNTAIWNGARVVGPAIAGMAVAAFGEGICFTLNSVSFLAAIVSLAMLKLPAWKPQQHRSTYFEHFREGWDYVRDTMPVRSLLIVVGLMSLFGYAPTVLMPLFADNILHGGASALGMLMGAMGLGCLLGGLSLARRQEIHGLGRVVAITTGGYGVALALFAYSTHYWLSILLVVPVGYYLMRQSTASNSLLQYLVSNEMRGRVMAFYSMMWIGLTPVASLIAGTAASRLGAPAALAIGGIAGVLVATAFGLRLPRFWTVAGPMLTHHARPAENAVTELISASETES